MTGGPPACAALLAALLVAGCATRPAIRSLAGQWGGQHVGLELGEHGGTLDYDCAAGAIEGPLTIGADGRFIATGTHAPGQGGPAIVGQVDQSFPASYSGRVVGDEMVLIVDVAARSTRLGPFTLRRGVPPTLMRCL